MFTHSLSLFLEKNGKRTGYAVEVRYCVAQYNFSHPLSKLAFFLSLAQTLSDIIVDSEEEKLGKLFLLFLHSPTKKEKGAFSC